MEHSIEEHEVLLPPNSDTPLPDTQSIVEPNPNIETIVETVQDIVKTIIADSVKEEIAPLEEAVAKVAATIFDSDALIHQLPVDSIVKSVLTKFVSRAEFGMKKYGTNLDRKDLNVLDWIQHAQEEHMDAILYLEKLKKEIKDTGIAAQKLLSQVPLADTIQPENKNLFKKIAHYICNIVK